MSEFSYAIKVNHQRPEWVQGLRVLKGNRFRRLKQGRNHANLRRYMRRNRRSKNPNITTARGELTFFSEEGIPDFQALWRKKKTGATAIQCCDLFLSPRDSR